ncbi:MAG TPA: EamA family transporter [Bryobacteraceae bacterium]|nr:EamA family transporter [Bryobacteraceae bacterium]
MANTGGMPSSALRPQTQPLQRTAGYLSCALAGCCWGTGFFFGKVALEELSVAHMVLYRIAFGSLGMLPVVLLHRQRFSRNEWLILLVSALLGVPIQFLIQFEGLAHTTVSHASLMVGTMPVILALGAAIFAHERLDRIGWAALGASTLGAGLIALSGKHSAAAGTHGPSLYGDLLVVFSLIVALGWILLNKRLIERHPPLVVTAYVIITGTAMLAIWVVLRDGPPPVHISGKAWFALAASGLLATALSTSAWNWGLGRIPASEAGVFLNLEPLIGSLLGITLLGESLGPAAWIGGAAILAAAFILTSRRK